MPRRRKDSRKKGQVSAVSISTYTLEGFELEIAQLIDPANKYQFPSSTGNYMWDASEHLARWITKQQPDVWAGRRCVELGSGLGLVGLAAACCGASVVLTDLPANVLSLQNNVRLNGDRVLRAGGAVAVEELDWGICEGGGVPAAIAIEKVVAALGGPPEIILASDVTWSASLRSLLLATMLSLIGRHCRSSVDVHIAYTPMHIAHTSLVHCETEGELTFHLGPLMLEAGFKHVGETKIGDGQGTSIMHYASG